VDGAAEPVSEKEGLLRAKQAAKQATLTVEAAALIAAEPGERLGALGSVGIVNGENDAMKAAPAADAESVADAEAEEAAVAETCAMLDEFIASYVQRAGVSLPLHLVECLDDAEKGAVCTGCGTGSSRLGGRRYVRGGATGGSRRWCAVGWVL
jgi:hypothetical protein